MENKIVIQPMEVSCECRKVAQKFVDRFGGSIIEEKVFVPPTGVTSREVMDFCYSIPRHVNENGSWVPCE